MKCPNCNHVSGAALLKCSSCGEAYDRAALEHWQELEYLLVWLEERERAADLKGDVYDRLRGEAVRQLDAARAALRITPHALPQPAPAPPPPPTVIRQPEEIARVLSLVLASLDRVPRWRDAGYIGSASAERLRQHLNTRAQSLRAELGAQTVKIESPTEEQVLIFALGSLEIWRREGHIVSSDVEPLRAYLAQQRAALKQPAPAPQPLPATAPLAPKPTPVPAPQSLPATAPLRPRPAPAPQPLPATAPLTPKPVVPTPVVAQPPKPAQPPIDWGKVWERAWGLVVSGALLRGLLYLGALMIVVSAIVLVVAFWGSFHLVLKIGFIAAVPLSFYAGGFLLRNRLKIPVAGGVFTGIGAVLVAVDFAAVYQLGGLRTLINVQLYWLIASIVCTALYIFTAWRVRGEFFAYLTLIGLANTAVAFTSLLGAPLEWRITAITASGAAMMAAAGGLRRRPPESMLGEIALAAHRLPHLLIPVSLFLVLLVPGNPAFGQMTAFLFASIGYGLLAEYFPSVVFVHAAMWSSVGAILFALKAVALPGEWYATAAAVLAPVYLIAGRALRQRLIDFAPPRRGYQGAVNLVGFGLVIVAIIAGFISLIVDPWAGVIALTLASVVLAWCAYLFRRPAFAFLASGLFIAPFTIAVARWLYLADAPQWGAWLMTTWAALALAYLLIAALLRRAEKYVTWLNLWAHALAPLAIFGLLINYAFTVRVWFNIPTLIALGGVIAVYAASAVIHDGRRHPALSRFVSWLPRNPGEAIFLWPIGLLLPVWAAVAWWGTVLSRDWFGGVLAAIALAYVGAGQLLAKRKMEYRFPPHVLAYALAIIGIAIALGDRVPLMTTLYLAVAVFAALAAVYRRAVETTIASAIFLWPFYLSLQLLNVTPHAFSLAFALLAAFGYLPLGIVLDRAGRKFALPQYVIGYGIAALSVAASLGGRFDLYPLNVQWIAVAVPLVAAGQQLFSLYRFQKPPFAWAAAVALAIAFGQTLTLLRVPPEYDAAAWVGLAFAYMLVERGLVLTVTVGSVVDAIRERSQHFRWPLGIGAIVLCGLGLFLTAPDTLMAFIDLSVGNYFPPLLAQTLAVGFVVLAARLHHSRWPLFFEPPLAFVAVTLFFIGYGERIFGALLTPPQFGIVWSVLGIVHLITAALLDRNRARYSHGLYLGGYALAAFAVLWTLIEREVLLWTLGLGIAAAIGSALLAHFNRHWTWDQLIHVFFGPKASTLRTVARGAFIWVAAWPFPIWCVLLLQQLNVANGFYWLGFGIPALALLGLGVWLRRIERTYAWPLNAASHFYTAFGLIISAPLTIRWLSGQFTVPGELFAITQLTAIGFIALQTVAVIFYAASARSFQWRIFAYVAAWLSFVPYTLAWIRFDPALSSAQVGIVWSALALSHLAIAIALDRTKARYSHGPYTSGYALAVFAVGWTLFDRGTLLWTLGVAMIAATVSALLTHFNRHYSWDELIAFFLGQNESTLRSTVRGAFIWAATWPFPIWCVLLLRQFDVADGFYWLGFGVPALALLGLGVWLRRIERTYAWPLNTAAHFYTALGLIIGAPITFRLLAGFGYSIDYVNALPFIILQTAAVAFYAASAWAFRWRSFAHAAAWLSFFPYTLAWIRFGPPLSSVQLALVWVGLAAAMLGIGFALDRARTRYAHGPYLFGYILAGFALVWSTPDRVVNIYTLGAAIVIALASHAVAHYGRHRSFDDLVNFVWRGRAQGSPLQRAVRTAFLFFAAYAFPVWLAQLMAHNQVPLAWRGLGLALAAPIYIAFGLAARRVRSEYTWPLYSMGYALTAIGAMVAFDNVLIAIYVLALDAVVYAASAYIFRQSFWLYLSNTLIPVVTLLTLHYNDTLTEPWASGLFMGLAFLYFFIGQWFNRGKHPERNEVQSKDAVGVHPFALPFHSIGYVLSAVAMAVASNDKILAIEVYSAGVALYAISAWAFRESVFLYPAVWLAAVPYYLGMTLTALPPEWYGLGWLPLVVACIALGKFVFHKTPLGNFKTSARAVWDANNPTTEPPNHPTRTFTHPALPFYLLAYALSVSMIVISQHTPITFTVALVAGAIVYFGSAALFRRAVWLYPGLFAAHFALMSYFAINPSGRPAQYITLPFLGLTWLIALIGYAFSRRFPVAHRTESGKLQFKFGRWDLEFGSLPIVGHLITPSWAQAFFIFAALDVIFWQFVALGRYETAIIVATGFMLLIMLFATFWQDPALAYGTLAFLLLAVGYRLNWAALPLADSFAIVGGIGFGLYLVARIAERSNAAMRVWIKPLTNAAILLTGLAVVVTLPSAISRTLASAGALAFAGALYLTIAFRGRYYRLGYTAMAMLQLAWVLILAFVKIAEPQLYALPAGLYFTGMGFLERRRPGARRVFAVAIESFGLAVLLLPSFVQSLNGGAEGLPYFVLLIAEGLLVLWWGAARRFKIPFFIGLAASALNVAGQIVVLFGGGSTLIRWAIIGSAGLLLVTAAVFVERQRAILIARAQEWREALERWE